MRNEDYELLPHEELERLRKELDHLKKNPYSDSKENKNLLDTMSELNTSIKKLTAILEDAQEDLIKEYSEASPSKLLKQISSQNAKIAEGILALSELVRKQMPASQGARPASQPLKPRMMPIPPRVQPPSGTLQPQQYGRSSRDLSAFEK
ncbi:MAG: hypothetical protein KJ583_04365 [Nanoarchaeota archaeon]|nr:hypothetical protein [Nanoarchaeota archaeon]MBU1270306.1 hypothetical protein [Nanoarchaeota archaeon]MBU1604526.1 hypothetical protein [Nanoarchaeota archaeon]MBU2442861.1 hypothetical protein [Nanoarchaeota archaeon]